MFISADKHTNDLTLLDSLDSGIVLSDDDGWPDRTIRPAELFPDDDLSQEDNEEDKKEELEETMSRNV